MKLQKQVTATPMTAAMMRSKTSSTVAVILLTVKEIYKINNQYFAACSRDITRMKQAKGAGGMSGVADDDDFQVVPVESTSEYGTHLYFSW